MSRVQEMGIDQALEELLLTRPVTSDDIVRAYRRMALRFHPDKVTDLGEKQWVQRKFLRIQEAYELLKDLPVEETNAVHRRAGAWESGEVGERPWGRAPGAPVPASSRAVFSSSPLRKILLRALIPAFFLVLLPALVMHTWDRVRKVRGGGTPATVAPMPRDLQSFGSLRAIGFGPDGRNFAEFERLSTPIYSGDVIFGYEIQVLDREVRFRRDDKSWTCTPSLP